MSKSEHDRAGAALSADARALIDGALGADDPSSADRARVHAALMATLASGAGVAASGAAASTASASASASGASASTVAATAASTAASTGLGVAGLTTFSMGAKLAAVALVVGVVGTTAVVQPWAESPEAEPLDEVAVAIAEPSERLDEPAAVAAEPALGAAQVTVETARDVEPVVTAAPEGEPIAEARVARAGVRPPRRPSTAAEAPPEAAVEEEAAPVSTLADEVALLRQAQRAIRDQAPERALRLLSEHRSRFPNGVMVAERDAVRAMALCASDGAGTEAQNASAAFLRSHPSSPLASRVRAACE